MNISHIVISNKLSIEILNDLIRINNPGSLQCRKESKGCQRSIRTSGMQPTIVDILQSQVGNTFPAFSANVRRHDAGNLAS